MILILWQRKEDTINDGEKSEETVKAVLRGLKCQIYVADSSRHITKLGLILPVTFSNFLLVYSLTSLYPPRRSF